MIVQEEVGCARDVGIFGGGVWCTFTVVVLYSVSATAQALEGGEELRHSLVTPLSLSRVTVSVIEDITIAGGRGVAVKFEA